MNSTSEATKDEPSDNQGPETVGPYGYSIGISFGILLALVIITYCYYIYTRFRSNTNNRNHPFLRRNSMNTTAASFSVNDDSASIPQGLDEATILSYPKLLYSQAKNPDGASTASGCSICLQDYKDTDMLRLLPECGHFFHLKCVDPWLKLNPTCPVCRNSPMPSPLEHPLAVENMVPLSTR
ncbi:RING-H2 finger protein ATL70-like [Coffea arabica]|uniref:RING-type E3 ubiquitin transferase n=1 Tax=Coffea arabica TaxID=13443 RepID=A0A6P6VEH1_COFAR|nr:RING-H2 finger protein ATL70-like [Coffea arabica]